MKLGGQAAIVTGAGRGIGRAVALALAREGAAVVVAARTRSEIEAVGEEIRSRGGRALPVQTDVTREDSVAELVARALAEFDHLDLLVTAAGNASFGPVIDSKLDEWESMMAVNLRGVFLACRAALAPMVSRRRGTIINIVSVAAKRAVPGCAAYAASKHGVLGFTQALAEEVRPHGIRVGAICPGAVDTRLWDSVADPPDRSLMLIPEDVAEAAILMASLPPRASLEDLTILPSAGIL